MTCKFNVGDYVVADTKPNCVQRVESVKWDAKFSGGTWMLKLIIVWRLDPEPIADKKSAWIAEWAFKKADFHELLNAAARLQDVARRIK